MDIPKSVADKIFKVMQTVSYLQKDGDVDFTNKNTQSRTKYNFLSEEKVTKAITDARKEVGLLFLPLQVEVKKESSISSVLVTYLIADSETGEGIQIQMAGQGADSQDKGVAKALTQAFKYAQRQVFGLSTGDDPDHISSAELEEQEKENQRKQEEKAEKDRETNKKLEENIRKLWVDMKGDEEGLKDWVDKKMKEKKSLLQMNDILQSELNKRKSGKGKKGEKTS